MTTHCHPDELAARVQLAACYRIFAMLGWTEMIYNHITVRVPTTASGDEKQFLINPYGLHYSEVTASNLVKINLKGEVLDGSQHRINPAGFVVHATLHDGIEGAHCVMHTLYGGRGGCVFAKRFDANKFLLRAIAQHGRVPRL